jgi:RNA polymerase sigma-70 factor (ECF subfamily)
MAVPSSMTDPVHPGEPRPHLRVLPGGAHEGQKTDDELLRAFLVGDDASFGELIERHQHAVITIARRYTRDLDDAHDLAQKAFLRALEAARKTLRSDPPDAFPFRAWLIRIALNLGKNHVRDAIRWRRAPVEEADEADEAGGVARTPAVHERMERDEQRHMMQAAVRGLPERQRDVLTLRVDGELSFRQIAETLGITENNAKVHFHHAAKKLRALLSGGEP